MEDEELYCTTCRCSFSQLKEAGRYRIVPWCIGGMPHTMVEEPLIEFKLANHPGSIRFQ